MTTIYKSAQSQAARPPVTLSQAGQAVSIRGFVSLPIATIINDTFQMVKLPANTVLDDLILDLDPIDSNATPTAVLQVGVLNAALTALNGPVLIATIGAQSKTGGVFRADMNGATFGATPLANAIRLGAQPFDRFLGVLVQAAVATGIAPTAVTLNRGAWAASTAYATGDYITLPNGSVMKCTTAGVSGILSARPEFATLTGATTTDGTVTWTSASVVIGLTARYRNQNFGA